MSKRRDLICALILFAIATLYYGLARDLGRTALSDAIGPAGLPRIYAAVLAALAVLLALAAANRRRQSARAASCKGVRPGRQLWRALGALAIGIAYLLIVPLIGYPFAAALAIAAMAAYQGERLGWRLVLIAAVGAAGLFVLFELVLGVPMPAPWNA